MQLIGTPSVTGKLLPSVFLHYLIILHSQPERQVLVLVLLSRRGRKAQRGEEACTRSHS